jgi:hypothetical protein
MRQLHEYGMCAALSLVWEPASPFTPRHQLRAYELHHGIELVLRLQRHLGVPDAPVRYLRNVTGAGFRR